MVYDWEMCADPREARARQERFVVRRRLSSLKHRIASMGPQADLDIVAGLQKQVQSNEEILVNMERIVKAYEDERVAQGARS